MSCAFATLEAFIYEVLALPEGTFDELLAALRAGDAEKCETILRVNRPRSPNDLRRAATYEEAYPDDPHP